DGGEGRGAGGGGGGGGGGRGGGGGGGGGVGGGGHAGDGGGRARRYRGHGQRVLPGVGRTSAGARVADVRLVPGGAFQPAGRAGHAVRGDVDRGRAADAGGPVRRLRAGGRP